ncbi:hypothetical protein [Rhodococcoides kroppenstedtii]|uniref:hypothetical protein n=1 Tax=Rhodococcoides kroppenstedtii TaxID=293050 RepID=UPI002952CD0C|nr:hypothetical protein [Rhodococcus kroppenstedtii]
MPEHYKVDPLSDAAFRGLIEAWCLCSRTRNDGHIPKATWVKKIKLKARRELLAVGLAIDNGETIEMHDYLEHQTSAAEIEATRKKRAQAGAAGGRRKAENLANGLASARAEVQQNPSQDVPEVEEEEEEEPTQVSASAYVSDARGPAVPANGWKLVRAVIPEEHPQAVKTALAIKAGELIKSGTDITIVEAALALWMTKPHLGPRALPSLVSEVIKGQTPRNINPQPGPATTKALGWLATAEGIVASRNELSTADKRALQAQAVTERFAAGDIPNIFGELP